MQRIQVIDSHTEGEPTRVVVAGAPDVSEGPAQERLQILERSHDGFRSAVIREPRGSDVLVGAVLYPAASSDAIAQAIFFNNVGYLGMCVHGAIGVARTLAHLGRIGLGTHRLETPAGDVQLILEGSGDPAAARITIENVPSFRQRSAVTVETPSYGPVSGDVAYGGNWFFLVDHAAQGSGAGARIPPVATGQVESLSRFAGEVRRSLSRAGVTGHGGAEIDHVEVFGPPERSDADSKNFVLCPGGAWDRSPCGTGTSAKMACLAAEGRLREGEVWRQESIIGSLFEGSIRGLDRTGAGLAESVAPGGGVVIPTVSGRAHITAEATLLLHPDDPLREGLRC